MGYAVHVEKFPGSIDGLCGRKGFLVIRDPAIHKITCSGCVNSLKKGKRTEEKYLIEEYEANPDLHVEKMPDPIKVRLEYVFSFRPYDGEFAHRGTKDRWWVFQDDTCIGRVTKKHSRQFMSYPPNTQFGKAQATATLLDACLALAKTPDPHHINMRDELVKQLQELKN